MTKSLRVKCVNNENQEKQLTVGKIYTVEQLKFKVNDIQDAYVIIADDGEEWTMSSLRFETIK